MFLKSLEIFGFKSFADKTKVLIEPGITVIVGPNGCGKSNIVDGVRWALGERQARNIRGEKMEDIIFNGTDNRKPMSLAEVSITIDNKNKILDLDSSSVQVSRRVFRDGESEYLINKSPVRLKDIDKLFMDTGIGKTSYSIMEQGKIDLILSSRADDRRFFFEEAAGISKYKYQKKESEKKLFDTAGNLERINDIIKEIEREKNIKSKQAEKTKEYISLKNKLSTNDIKINILKYRDSQKKREKILTEIEELKMKREKISARVSKISAENESDEKEKNDIQIMLFELDKELHANQIKLEDLHIKTEKNNRLIKEQNDRKEIIKNKINESITNSEQLKNEKKKTEEAGINIEKNLINDNEKLNNLIDIRKTKYESITNCKYEIENNKARIDLEEESLRELREVLEIIIKRLIDAIEKRKAELQSSEVERQQIKDQIADDLSKMETRISEAIKKLDSGNVIEASRLLQLLDTDSLKSNIIKFQDYEDGFRSLLFDKTGIHAEKETIDEKIYEKVTLIDNLRAEILLLEEKIHNIQGETDEINNNIAALEKNIIKNENEKNWIERHIQSLMRQIVDIEKHIENYTDDLRALDKNTEIMIKEINEWSDSIIEFNKQNGVLQENVAIYTEKRNEIEQTILQRKDNSKKDIQNQKAIVENISVKEKLSIELDFRLNNIEEHLWTEYEKRLSDLDDFQIDVTDSISDIQGLIQNLKREMQELGPINNLAIEEYKELKKRFDYYIQQRDDIEKAREDILAVIDDIDKTSSEMFFNTFNEIKKNFADIFKELFEGGNATIELTDEENILESGIDILARPPGKKLKDLNLLSGGERALTAIALLFATYMVRPSPFCFLDEIDASLDEENIGRFIRMLQKFAKKTQFIIVTHNKKTMSTAESIYGVTMEEPGISKVVSYRIGVMGETLLKA